ncbi:MAG: NADH-quinone oxidoreductase subunit J [Candidatus Promineifilaceae bacterium]|jgi:NADH-quinone oxidoreductase subunit J
MQIVFILVSAMTLFSGIQTVSNRNLFHAALYMMVSFLGVAILYGMLESAFMAATQLLVYIGAISILVIFAIMMTRRLMHTTESSFNSQWQWGGLSAALLFVVFVTTISQVFTLNPYAPGAFFPPAAESAVRGTVVQLGEGFVSADQYVLAFELASVLLLIALVGAIIVARPDVAETTQTNETPDLAEVEMNEASETAEVEMAEAEMTEIAEVVRGGH